MLENQMKMVDVWRQRTPRAHRQVIKANDDLTPDHHQFFLYQMLRGLKYIHSGEGA